MIEFLLLLVGFILFVLAGFGVPAGRHNLVAWGLAAWILTALISAWP